MKRVTLAIALVVLGCCARSEAQADDPALTAPEPAAGTAETVSASDSEAYSSWLAKGVDEYAAGHWIEARALFNQAHAEHPTARTHRSLGMCDFNLRNYVSAVLHLEAALASSERPLTLEQRTQVSELLDGARVFVGRITVHTEPVAEVLIDSREPVLDANRRILLSVGEHAIEASATGYQTARRSVHVTGGEQQDLTLVLEVNRPVIVVAAAPKRFVPRWSPRPGWIWGTTAAAGAAAGFAVVSAVIASGEQSDIEERCARERCFAESTSTRTLDRWEGATNASIAASATLGAVALGLLTWRLVVLRRDVVAPREVSLGGGVRQLSVRGTF